MDNSSISICTIACIIIHYCRLAMVLILLVFGLRCIMPNAQRNAHIFVPRNGRFGVQKRLGKLTQSLKFLVVSNYRTCTSTMNIIFIIARFPFNKSVYKRGRDDSINNLYRLGVSQCCDHLSISSNGEANDMHWYTMGDYHYFGDDPDGARIYHNPKHNGFITRNHRLNTWTVS